MYYNFEFDFIYPIPALGCWAIRRWPSQQYRPYLDIWFSSSCRWRCGPPVHSIILADRACVPLPSRSDVGVLEVSHVQSAFGSRPQQFPCRWLAVRGRCSKGNIQLFLPMLASSCVWSMKHLTAASMWCLAEERLMFMFGWCISAPLLSKFIWFFITY